MAKILLAWELGGGIGHVVPCCRQRLHSRWQQQLDGRAPVVRNLPSATPERRRRQQAADPTQRDHAGAPV